MRILSQVLLSSLLLGLTGSLAWAQSPDGKKVIINNAKPASGKPIIKPKVPKSALENIPPIETGFKEPSSFSIYEVPEMEPVMSKKYNLNNEISGNLSYLPVGAFNKYVTIGGSYVRYFDHTHGWEVINAAYAVELASRLKKDLKTYYGATDKDFPVLQWMATTNYIYTPFYTKSVLLNRKQVYSQLSFLAGAGIADVKIKSVTLLNAGVTQRFYSGDASSMKFDFRYIHFLGNDAVLRNQITLTFGWAYHFGGTR